MKELTKVIATDTSGGDVNMKPIWKGNNGPIVMAAWNRDIATCEKKLALVAVYPNEGISTVREYQKSKLKSSKAFEDLADMDGIDNDDLETIYIAYMRYKDKLPVICARSEKSSIVKAYHALVDYVRQYEEPGAVFIKDGYGNILSTRLKSVLERLDLGYSRLELERNFKTWNLIRASEEADHPYTYKINTGSANDWYFSFKLDSAKGEKTT